MNRLQGRLLSLPLESAAAGALLSALDSDRRQEIVKLLARERLNVNEIAERLGLPQSTVAPNVKALELAGLLNIENKPGGRGGSQKICSLAYDAIILELPTHDVQADDHSVEIEMPIGLYVDFEVSATCGMCSVDTILGKLDVPDSFLSPERSKAALIWFAHGFVEYKFPRNIGPGRRVKRIEVCAELCSEAPGSNRDWPSDITVWINGQEVGTWTSPSDFGGVRGKLTPHWWRPSASQYGLLTHWTVTESGGFLDGNKVSNITVGDLDLQDHRSIRIRLGIKDDAVNRGGINLFGRGFGNYDQDLLLRMEYE
jgi:predicted transcriptional regulator